MQPISVLRTVLLSASSTLVFAGTIPAAEEKAWAGHITDEMCGSEHMMEGMTHPECAISCMEMGAALQLYVEAEEAIYAIADQKQAEQFAGMDVTVVGVLSEDGETVTIHSIESR